MGMEEGQIRQATCDGCKELTEVRHSDFFGGNYCEPCMEIMTIEEDAADMIEEAEGER